MDDIDLLLTALHHPVPRDTLEDRLDHLGGLYGLGRAGATALDGLLSEAAADRLDAIFALSARLHAPPKFPARISEPEDVVAFLGPRIANRPVESFWVILLDARGRPLGYEEVARGTLTACLVHPREVFQPAIQRRAASVLVVHNHPSGDASPSPEDIALTARLSEAGAVLGIPVVDHLVLARSGFRSLGGTQVPGQRRSVGLQSSGSNA